jgi:hypothetical protein
MVQESLANYGLDYQCMQLRFYASRVAQHSPETTSVDDTSAFCLQAMPRLQMHDSKIKTRHRDGGFFASDNSLIRQIIGGGGVWPGMARRRFNG